MPIKRWIVDVFLLSHFQFLSIDHTENLRGDSAGGWAREIRPATEAWTETVDEEMGPKGWKEENNS
jgi:hypothetical protein